MEISIYQVDAFADKVFKGNPAAVCPLVDWIDASLMQSIAEENNLAETAFFVQKEKGVYEIRFFMPYDEIDLCGHATLASAYVVFNFIETSIQGVEFHSQAGVLKVNKLDNGFIKMNFPSRPPKKIKIPKEIFTSFNYEPVQALASRDLLLRFESEEQIKTLTCNLSNLKELPYVCIIATAKGVEYDFVSRVFDANAITMPEDPVTGSAHASLIPYWKEVLGKDELLAMQLSNRGGELLCKYVNDRVEISGKAVLYLKGVIYI